MCRKPLVQCLACSGCSINEFLFLIKVESVQCSHVREVSHTPECDPHSETGQETQLLDYSSRSSLGHGPAFQSVAWVPARSQGGARDIEGLAPCHTGGLPLLVFAGRQRRSPDLHDHLPLGFSGRLRVKTVSYLWFLFLTPLCSSLC